MMIVRCKSTFSGRVQGVGFRFTCLEVARRHPIHGQVKNMPNGSVEILVEGEKDDIDAFLSDVKETVARVTRGQIESVNNQFEGIEDCRFASFEIVR